MAKKLVSCEGPLKVSATIGTPTLTCANEECGFTHAYNPNRIDGPCGRALKKDKRSKKNPNHDMVELTLSPETEELMERRASL